MNAGGTHTSTGQESSFDGQDQDWKVQEQDWDSSNTILTNCNKIWYSLCRQIFLGFK